MVNKQKISIFIIFIFFICIGSNVFSKGHGYSKETCKEIYFGISYFLKEADLLWKKKGSLNDKKALLYSQAAANYSVVYDTFCKHEKEKKRRPNFENAAKVLNLTVKEIKEALGKPPDYKQASEKLGISMKELVNALYPRKNEMKKK